WCSGGGRGGRGEKPPAPPQHGMIRSSDEHPPLVVGDSQSRQRGILQVEGEGRFRLCGLFLDQTPINADYLERSLFQVVRFFRIQRQYLPRDLTVGNDERRDRAGAEPPHSFEPMQSVRCPKRAVRRGY